MFLEYEYHWDVWAGSGACDKCGRAFGGGYTSGGWIRGRAWPSRIRGKSPTHAVHRPGGGVGMIHTYLMIIIGVAMVSLGVVRHGVHL